MCYGRVTGKYSRRDNHSAHLVNLSVGWKEGSHTAGSKGRRERFNPAVSDLTESRRVLRISNTVFFAEIGTMSSLDCVSTIFPLLIDPGQTNE